VHTWSNDLGISAPRTKIDTHGNFIDAPTIAAIGWREIRVRDFHGEKVLNPSYRFRPEVWGKSYAVEVAQGIMEWCTRQMPSVSIVATVNVANKPSIRVAERLGFENIPRRSTTEFFASLQALTQSNCLSIIAYLTTLGSTFVRAAWAA
jgi:Acetyltransferase (GNAT) domain